MYASQDLLNSAPLLLSKAFLMDPTTRSLLWTAEYIIDVMLSPGIRIDIGIV
jgi:hypothetical protein